MVRHGKRDLAKEQFWRRALARFATSGKTRAKFCDDEGLSSHVFKYWDEVILERDAERHAQQARAVEFSTEAFIPVFVAEKSANEPPDHSKPVVEFVFTGGHALVFKSVDLATLKMLLLAIRETAS